MIATLPGNSMFVRVRGDLEAAKGNRRYHPGVLIGSRTYTPADGPIELDAKIARRLISEGTVVVVERLAIEAAERTITPKRGSSRR